MRKAARDSERRKTEDLSARGRGRGRGKGRGRGRKRKAPDLANMDEPDQNPEIGNCSKRIRISERSCCSKKKDLM